jgi:hypothetical protein
MEYNASGPDRSIRLRMSQQRMSMAADSGASGQNFTKQEVSWAGSLSVKPFRQLFEISQSQAAMNSAQTTLPAKHCDRPLRRAVQHDIVGPVKLALLNTPDLGAEFATVLRLDDRSIAFQAV